MRNTPFAIIAKADSTEFVLTEDGWKAFPAMPLEFSVQSVLDFFERLQDQEVLQAFPSAKKIVVLAISGETPQLEKVVERISQCA